MLDRLALSFLHRMDAEQAHRLTIRALKCGFGPKPRLPDDPRLVVEIFGKRFSNPIGLAAGFDKNAEVMGPMAETGLGFVEVGSITPRPQPGNPRPRIFRLPADQAVINRLGFNNEGVAAAQARLTAFRAKDRNTIVGVNLGKNKTSEDAAADYAAGAKALAPFADYLVINVSSPNTPGLRALQDPAELRALVQAVEAASKEAGASPPILVKIAPDLEQADLEAIATLALEPGIAGLIVSNTTIARPDSLRETERAEETGGLSGKPLFQPSTEVLKTVYRLTAGKKPLIGVGGISSGADAYAKIRAGASLVQLYTGLIYHGPVLVARMRRDLATCLERDGFASIAEATGVDAG